MARRIERVSVLVPTRRWDRYTEEAVRSALSDMDDVDELVLIFDGPLTTPSIEDPRLRVFATGTHVGTPHALNMGIALCEGELILRLDSDDIALPGRRDRMVREFNARTDLVLLGSAAQLIDERGAPIGMLAFPTRDADIRARLLLRNSFVHSSVAYRKTLLLELGGYNERCLRMQDYELFLRLAQKGTMGNLPDALVAYRIHTNMSSRGTSPYRSYTREILSTRRDFQRSQGVTFPKRALYDLAWLGAQVGRYHRLRPPGYAKGPTAW